MSCKNCVDNCACPCMETVNATNICSRGYKAGLLQGDINATVKWTLVLLDLSFKEVISHDQMKAVFDLILKGDDAVDINSWLN